jgi:hypothetical protein
LESPVQGYCNVFSPALNVSENRFVTPFWLPRKNQAALVCWHGEGVDVMRILDPIVEGAIGKGEALHIQNWIAEEGVFFMKSISLGPGLAGCPLGLGQSYDHTDACSFATRSGREHMELDVLVS